MKTDRYYSFWYHLLWLIFFPFHPVRAVGRENIPEGGAVICPNHSAATDPFYVCFACSCRHRMFPMAKVEAKKIPVLGKLLEWGKVIFVDRDTADVHAVKSALQVLKEGRKLLIFPQGTRVKNGVDKHGNPVTAKAGAALFATRTGTPLIPVYIPEKRRWFRFNTVVIGQPYYPEISGRKATSEELEQITQELMDRIYALGEGQA